MHEYRIFETRTWRFRFNFLLTRKQRLDFLAEQTGRTRDVCLREIIERGLEDMEDYYLAAKVLKRVQDGGEQVYSAAEVKKSLGLDD